MLVLGYGITTQESLIGTHGILKNADEIVKSDEDDPSK